MIFLRFPHYTINNPKTFLFHNLLKDGCRNAVVFLLFSVYFSCFWHFDSYLKVLRKAAICLFTVTGLSTLELWAESAIQTNRNPILLDHSLL